MLQTRRCLADSRTNQQSTALRESQPALFVRGLRARILRDTRSPRRHVPQRRNVNSIMTATYWEIGRRIVYSEQQGEERAEYGQRLIELLAGDLIRQFGRGFGDANLWKMRAFYLAWPDERILSTLSRESIASSNFSNIAGISLPVLAARFTLRWFAYVCLRPPAVRQEPGSTEVLRGRGAPLRLVRPPARPADRKPILRAHRALKEQGHHVEKGRGR